MRNDDGVRNERTAWRDEWISQRHRLWGADCPAADIDFLAVEYDLAVPVAIVDYKAFQPRDLDLKGASFKALSWLADMAGIPFMIVFYNAKTAVFTVQPVNGAAKRRYRPNQVMSEQEYVASLYTLRKRSIPQALLARLSSFKPKRG